jgi:hypothetical protein
VTQAATLTTVEFIGSHCWHFHEFARDFSARREATIGALATFRRLKQISVFHPSPTFEVAGQWPVWVMERRTRSEHISSASPQKAEYLSAAERVRVAPKAAVRIAPASSGKRSTNTSLRAKAWDTAMPLKEGAPATGSRLG